MKKVRLTKLNDCDNPRHPENIKTGFVKEGGVYRELKVGESFWVGSFVTSVVQEIIDEQTFRTMNSIYQWEVIGETKSDEGEFYIHLN